MNNNLKKIKKVKTDFKNPLKIKIDNKIIKFIPVNDSVENIRVLTEWRKKYWNSFSSKFDVSNKRTKKWVLSSIVNDPKKILFILEHNGKKLGHVGFRNYNIKNKSIEIDNIVKGKQFHPQLMEKALKKIIRWAFDELDVSKITVEVFSDNHKAINLYERCNLLTIDSILLRKKQYKHGWEWIKIKKNSTESSSRYLSVLEIKKES